METYDAIVIGAGHNGLTAACYLAKSGMRVLVLESYKTVGGMTITEELTLPGFKSDVHASGYQLANFSPVPKELQFEKYGVELIKPRFPFAHAYPNGHMLSVHKQVSKTLESIKKYSMKDAAVYQQLIERYQHDRQHIIDHFFSPPLNFVDEAKQLAREPGMEQYRFSMQSVRSFVNETFESDESKSLFGSFASFLGASPDDATGASLAYLFAAVLQHEGNNLVKGGMQQVAFALANYLQEHGGTIKTDSKVVKILGDRTRATGVQLATGEEISAKLIVSNVDPAQLILKLLGLSMIEPELICDMKKYEWGDSVFVMYVALSGPVHYKAGADAQLAAHVHLSPPSLDALAQVYYQCRSGLLPQAPLIVSWNDGALDKSRVPQNKSLMKFVVLNVPYKIKGDATGKIPGNFWYEVKEAYADYLIDLITTNYIPDLKAKILKRIVHSPIDIERKITTAVHGTLAQGALLPYQHGALRPNALLGQYKCPVENVYLASSGSHPGAGVSFAAGRNAFQIICRDLNIDFQALLASL